MTDLGAQAGADLRYFATLLNSTNATRSNELQGVLTAPAGNIGVASYALAAGEWNVFGSPVQPTINGPVRLTFETYAGTGFQPTPACGQLSSSQWSVTGWSDGDMTDAGVRTTGDYARGSSLVAVTTGGFYSFTLSTGNRAFGIQPGGSDFAPGTATVRLQNASATTFNGADLSYSIYYRNDQARSSSLNLAWSTDNVTFVDMPQQNFISPDAIDAGVFVQTSRAATIGGFTLAPGGAIYVRTCWRTTATRPRPTAPPRT